MKVDWIWFRIKVEAVYGVKISVVMKRFILAFCILLPFTLAAQQPDRPTEGQVDTSPLLELGDEYQNSIKLLQNRFRIDYEVEEITMVFFRKFGSAPVVLVRPDGSKIFQIQADGEDISWYDATTYDLIYIKNPTPGPWQAVGEILPQSRVMVLSDVQLHADPLPDVIFSGEILKQTAYLTNGGDKINYPEFRDVVSLDIRLVSTNNPNYNNFGADVQTIATFEDNGRGMDEKPLDGTFTGQFNLAVADGEWTPVFVVSTPMFTREQVDPPLMLYPNPIKISMVPDGGGDGYHKLVIDAEREFVDMSTLLIDGKVRFPNGDVQNFSLTELTSEAREHLIVNYEFGVYRIKLTAFGSTKDGRDFILDVPEYTFLAETPEVEVAETTIQAEALLDTPENVETLPDPAIDMMAEVTLEAEPEDNTMVWWIIGANLMLLVVGCVVIWFFTRPKKAKVVAPQPPSDQPVKESALASMGKSVGNMFSKNKKGKAGASDDSGIIDLTIPED